MIPRYLYLVCTIEIPFCVDGGTLVCPSNSFFFTFDHDHARREYLNIKGKKIEEGKCIYPSSLRLHSSSIVVFEWNNVLKIYDLYCGIEMMWQKLMGIHEHTSSNIPQQEFNYPIKTIFNRQIVGEPSLPHFFFILMYGKYDGGHDQQIQGCYFTVLVSHLQLPQIPTFRAQVIRIKLDEYIRL